MFHFKWNWNWNSSWNCVFVSISIHVTITIIIIIIIIIITNQFWILMMMMMMKPEINIVVVWAIIVQPKWNEMNKKPNCKKMDTERQRKKIWSIIFFENILKNLIRFVSTRFFFGFFGLIKNQTKLWLYDGYLIAYPIYVSISRMTFNKKKHP